jgi:hypothetical protein
MTGGSPDLGRRRALVRAHKQARESELCAAENSQRFFSIVLNIKELDNYLNSYKYGMSTTTGRAIPRLGLHAHDALTMCKSWL